jgi:hypothetical protein
LADDLRFYETLPALERFADACDPERYARVPASWSVVVTDVKGSTRAVAEGRYKDVNVLGAASIAAAVNTCTPRPPFVFGGDGATFLVPGAQLDALAAALAALVRVAREAFGMELRAGAVPVADLQRDGFEVRVAKHAVSPGVSLAMLAGDGIDEATRRVKRDEERHALRAAAPLGRAPVEGLECRWRPLASRQGEIVTLLVRARARGAAAQRETYRGVLDFIAATFDEAGMRPVAVDGRSLATEPALLEPEARVRTGAARGARHALYRWKALLQNRWAVSLIRRGERAGSFDGARYPAAVAENSDFRKFDGMLRMVIDATPEQRARLEAHLAARCLAGEVDYGLTTAPTALMTCLVFDHATDHVHFIDGGNGGYTMAAKQMTERAGLVR